MATRAIPKIDAYECITDQTVTSKSDGAIDVANLRIDNKDLDFIQRQLNRTDDLTAQTVEASNYNDLVGISNNMDVLLKGVSGRAETIKDFTDGRNPMTEINNSEELLAKIENLSNVLTSKVAEFSSDYQVTSDAAFADLSNQVEKLQQAVNSSDSYPDLLNAFGDIHAILKNLIEGGDLRLIKDQTGSEGLIEQMNQLVESFESKAESLSGAFESSVSAQIETLNAEVDSLAQNIDQLSSAEQVMSHFQALESLGQVIKTKASEFNTIDESKELIQNINETSILSYEKAVDIIDGYKQVSNLEALVDNPETLAHAVKEASYRTNVSVVEEQLMPLVNDGQQLVAKVQQLATQFASDNLADLSERKVRMMDVVIGRLEVLYKSQLQVNINPVGVDYSLSDRLDGYMSQVEDKYEDALSTDPATLTEHVATFPSQLQSTMETSDISLFASNILSIPSDVMMNSRKCVDTAFKDFTREYGDTIEWSFDWLLTFLDSFEDALLWLPWPAFLLIVGALAFAGSHSKSVTIGSMLALFLVGYFDMWEPMISTVSLVTAATLLCLVVGIPLGIWMSRSERVQSMITPVLDIMQTIPSFVYLIPVVMLLGIGKVPGMIAVCIYAMPPIVRLTNLGIRLVDKEAMEAADAFGATYRQRLFTVQIPLALPNIFAGVNQTIMMALAMVVIASMIGVAGLGQPVLQAVQNQYLSSGMLNGLAIVVLAIVFDRVSQAFGTRIQKHRSGDVL